MSITGKYDDKWALRLAYDSTLNAFRFTDVSGGGGTTEVVSAAGTVTTTPISLPTVATGNLQTVLVQCGIDNTTTLRLDISFDGGTTYHRIAPGMSIEWDMNAAATQIQIKAASGTVQYYFTANRDV